MFSEVECVYRDSYVEVVTALLSACSRLEFQHHWLGALRLWVTLPQTGADDCPFPPNADGTSNSYVGTGWPNHTSQRTRCRGFSQGVDAAFSVVQPSLGEPLRTCFILITEPTRELTATANLVARRYEAFCPSVYRMRPVKRQGVPMKDAHGQHVLKKVESPMFPGYIFVTERCAVGRFEKIERVAGVRKFMRCGEAFAKLPAALVGAIQSEEARRMAAFEESTKATSVLGIPFAVGASARIDGGPYDDFVGKMVRLNKNGRLQMLLNLFGRERKVVVDAAQVRAA